MRLEEGVLANGRQERNLLRLGALRGFVKDVVRLVRARGDMPVIVMSARTTAADKVALLKLGADDIAALDRLPEQ